MVTQPMQTYICKASKNKYVEKKSLLQIINFDLTQTKPTHTTPTKQQQNIENVE